MGDWWMYVRLWRVRHGLTQTGAADRVGVSRATFSRWERNLTTPTQLEMSGYVADMLMDDLRWQAGGPAAGELRTDQLERDIEEGVER